MKSTRVEGARISRCSESRKRCFGWSKHYLEQRKCPWINFLGDGRKVAIRYTPGSSAGFILELMIHGRQAMDKTGRHHNHAVGLRDHACVCAGSTRGEKWIGRRRKNDDAQ